VYGESPSLAVIMSTITHAIIRLELKQFQNIKDSNFLSLSENEINILMDKCILTAKTKDEEIDYIWYLFNKDRLNPISLSSYLMLTENCNFSCEYCYQRNQTKNTTIKSDVLDLIINWFANKFKTGNYKICTTNLFGGEPLLNTPGIISFANKMKPLCQKNNIEHRLVLITNGYLLNNEVVHNLALNGLKEIHVSIDGDAESHNKRRHLKNGEPTFDIILQNIYDSQNFIKNEKLDLKIVLRIGFDNNNLINIKSLLSGFNGSIDWNITEVYFAPIYNTTAQICDKTSFCSQHALTDITSLSNAYEYLFSSMLNENFILPDYISSGPCMVLADNAVLIDCNGILFKCADMVGLNDVRIGSVENTIDFNPVYYKMMRGSHVDDCFAKYCKYINMCGGGCIMHGLTKENKVGIRHCEYELFERINKYLLGLKYL
jgi:uncharacterized protein